MCYIKIYLYKLIYKNKFKFKKGLRVSPSIEINIFDKSKLEIGKDFYCRKSIKSNWSIGSIYSICTIIPGVI